MRRIRFLRDYRGVLTAEQFYTAGQEAVFPDGHAAAMVEAGAAEIMVSEGPPADPDPAPKPPPPKPRTRKRKAP